MFEVWISCDAATAAEKKVPQVGKNLRIKIITIVRVAEIFIVIDAAASTSKCESSCGSPLVCEPRRGARVKTNGRRMKDHYRLTF